MISFAPPFLPQGERVRRERKRLGLSQEDLAFEADLHRTYIGSVERGERNISLLQGPPSRQGAQGQAKGPGVTFSDLPFPGFPALTLVSSLSYSQRSSFRISSAVVLFHVATTLPA